MTCEASQRVWLGLPPGTRDALRTLAGADLRTLLLDVARDRAAAATPAQVMRAWTTDRFVRPSDADARALASLEQEIWRRLPDDVAGLELSPVAPLGTCTAVAPVGQDRIVTTMRLTEVVSDSTNALAVEAARRRRAQGREGEVHLAATHRQLRAQPLGAGEAAHFRLFALVSSARDTGSARTEAALLVRHLVFWQRVLGDLAARAEPGVRLTHFDGKALRERLTDTVRPAVAGGPVPVVEDPGRERGRGYYGGAALQLLAGGVDLGDGGLIDATARLTGDAKERCLVSCLSAERLLAAVG